MSGAATSANSATTKSTTNDSSTPSNPAEAKKSSTQLEEDDEFEDFPVEDWAEEETDLQNQDNNAHLWEESWDDDDTSEDFAKQLKEELTKVGNQTR